MSGSRICWLAIFFIITNVSVKFDGFWLYFVVWSSCYDEDMGGKGLFKFVLSGKLYNGNCDICVQPFPSHRG